MGIAATFASAGGALIALGLAARAGRGTMSRRVRSRLRAVAGRVGPSRTPVILVPGILGTTLVDPEYADFPVWGDARGLLFYRRRYEDLDLPLLSGESNRLVAGKVLWNFPVLPFLCEIPVYEEFARSLEGLGCCRHQEGGRNGGSLLTGFCHDWRHGVVESARALEAAVERVLAATGAGRVHLVGHSWGSTIIRYYLRYGGADVLKPAPEPPRPGAGNIDTFFAVGAPFGGSLRALHEINHGFAPAGPVGRPVMPHHMSAAPVAYQLLPYGPELAVDYRGRPRDLPMDDTGTWRRRKWGPFRPATLAALSRRARRGKPGISPQEMDDAVESHLEAALARGGRLWRIMRRPHRRDGEVRTVVYASNNVPTLTRMVLGEDETLAADREVRRKAPELFSRIAAPGDGYIAYDEVEGYFFPHPTVEDPMEVPEGSYRMVVETPSHRDLLKQDALLVNLMLNVARPETGKDSATGRGRGRV